jgi:uncharacterized iron-regulated membrane protein
VPLSEHEQRLLEQMEQAMYAEDPKFASAMRGRSSRARQRRRFLLGGIGLVVGLLLVIVGVAGSLVWLAVLGFVLMLAGAAFGASPERKSGPVGAVAADGRPQPRRKRPAGNTSRETFLAKLEQRWEKRRDNGWGA